MVQAGIKADKSTLSAVRLMMEKGMELTGQNLKDILNIVTSLPKTDINTAVLMKSLGLEFSTGNFDNIKNIIEGRLQAGNIINETGSIINNINDAQALAKTGAVFEILKNIEMQTQAAEYNISSDTEVLLNTIPKSEIALFFQRNLEHSEIPSNLLDSFLASQFSHFSLFSEENREELNNILRHVFTNIKNNLQSERAVESDASILKLKNRIVSQIQDNRIILTENDEISNNIGKNLNEKIINRLEILSFIVRENQINDFENMGVRLDLITGQMKFLNNMASLGTYIQIPLILNNHDTTGNIYLMKRKKGSSKIDMDNVTFLISLDTGNLGRVDSLIDINKKNISLDIKTEKNDISSFIKKYYNYLYEKFREMGYRLINMKCSLITGDINILNFEKFIKKEKKEREKSIDYRI